MTQPSVVIAGSGAAYLDAMSGLAVTEARLGPTLFLACAGVGVAACAAIRAVVWHAPSDRRRLFLVAVLLALAFRAPLAARRVDSDNDMIRYLWDGRVQTLGLNPYAVRPADPEVAFTHTDETRDMPSARARTPYPPAAQLFFRLIVTLHDSSRAMKLALVLCDL